MKIRNIIVFALLASTTTAVAQQSTRFKRLKQRDTLLVKNYADSLAALKTRLDTTKTDVGSNDGDGRTFYLFSPATFYHSVVGNLLSGEKSDDTQTAIDRVMMNIYLNHPELVAKSEKVLNKAGAIDKEIKAPIKNKEKFVSKAEDNPGYDENFNMPVEIVVKKPNFWKYSGDYYLQMLQNYVSSNWYKGG